MLCLPDDAAREAVALAAGSKVRIVDASSAHRVAPGWTYGFPELAPGQRDALRSAKRITNPGCHATAFVALLRPLIDAGLIGLYEVDGKLYAEIPTFEEELARVTAETMAREASMVQEEVTADDIAEVVESWTGNPAGRLLEGESEKLLRMEDYLDKRVVGQPERGDIVIFKAPPANDTDYIKRVIGLPGDRIQMIANKLYINDKPVQDVVVSQQEINDIFGPRPVTEVRETLPNGKSFMTQDYGPGGDLDDTPVYEVPSGHFFMMGDNRDNSIDSRVEQSSGVGMVPAENLVGKAQIILFSWKPGSSLWNPVSWFNVRLDRFFNVLH